MATKKKTETSPAEISFTLRTKTIKVPIVGISSLIMSRFDEKSKQQIEEIGKASTGLKQGGKKKHIVPPEEQYENSIYYMPDGKRYGMPAVSFKAAMVAAGYRVFNQPQTVLRSAIFVIPTESDDPRGLVEIQGTPRMREDMVRIGTINKVASPRYRAEFPEWSATLNIQFLSNVISEEDVIGLLSAAGFACGVGEWRPEKSASGQHGRFQIAS